MATLHLYVRQRRIRSSLSALTVDAGIASRLLVDLARDRHDWLPRDQIQYRVPVLVSGEDRWWMLPAEASANDHQELALEMRDSVAAALPFLIGIMSDTGLRDRWAAERSFLNDAERRWLDVLEAERGPSPVVEEQEKDPPGDLATEVVQQLRAKGYEVEGPPLVEDMSVPDAEAARVADDVVQWLDEVGRERKARSRSRLKDQQ